MERTIKTKLDAAHEWVREFNAVDINMISKLMNYEPCDWEEVTLPAIGDTVFIYDASVGYLREGEIYCYNNVDDLYLVETDDGETLSLEKDSFEVLHDDVLPMWGTMWQFGDPIDDWWLEHNDGLKIMSECGFRIYHSEEFGFFFGIDGAGYDFYSQHWLPLYEARGLRWHDEEDADNTKEAIEHFGEK